MHTHSTYIEHIFMFILILIQLILTINILNIYFYKLYTCMCVYLYIYIININITHTYILCKQKLCFKTKFDNCDLINCAINCLTTLVWTELVRIISISRRVKFVGKFKHFLVFNVQCVVQFVVIRTNLYLSHDRYYICG